MADRKIICPACRKTAAWDENPFRPFCSERCRLIDLGKWAAGDYRIAGPERPLESGEEEEKK